MSESSHQKSLIKWWELSHKKLGLPVQALFAIPNGGARSAATGANLKLEGVRKGVFDLRLEVRRGDYTGMYIEMKYDQNKLTPEQKSFELMAISAGAHTAVCYDWESAKIEIEEYLK